MDKLIALRHRHRNREISSEVFSASLVALGVPGYAIADEVRSSSPDPLQPDADTIRVEASRRWLLERLKNV
jgi:hypothetical protein